MFFLVFSGLCALASVIYSIKDKYLEAIYNILFAIFLFYCYNQYLAFKLIDSYSNHL